MSRNQESPDYCFSLSCTNYATEPCLECKDQFCRDCVSQRTHDCTSLFARIPIDELPNKKAIFRQAMEAQGFLVLSNCSQYLKNYHHGMEELKRFFEEDFEQKKTCTSTVVYWNERGVPMWHCGFEFSKMREAFRVPTEKLDLITWPNEHFQTAWQSMVSDLQLLTDECLEILVDMPIERPKPQSGSDKSVCYAVFYPNNRGGQQEEGINISEHVDPSLVVLEPCTLTPGMEIYDRTTHQWLTMEKYCRPDDEIIVFAGSALERATNQRVRGTLHRVSQCCDAQRHVVVFEQKYSNFYPPPRF
eukprot:c11870_g1_i1.p1 GENE.c11870_g1_i1~~c11870_g1_i1.p1  ORF type:complete len:303 (+),score=60.24 c11870_g1_i1:58-966(+)